MAHLFSKTVIEEAIRNIEIPNIESKISILRDWLNMYNSGTLQKKSEKEFEGVYNESLFGIILGYSSASSETYTREKEPRNESNGQKCDIGLGFFTPELSKTQAIVELKDAATSLDRPQQRAGNLTPVQQAFKYKPLYNSKWVIVSNFFEIRLYTDTYQDFESFTLRDLIDEKNNYENFRVFYTLFHAEKLIKKEGESETEQLLAKVRIEEEKISKEFYKEYKTLRLDLMRDIWKNNPDTRNADVIEKAQRIVDRIVFICFCEDRRLLPQNELTSRIQTAKTLGFSPWEMLKRFFQSIDKGDTTLGIPDGYNGGLFRADESIDNLKISDNIVEKFINLGRYDFSEDGGQLSVEILGHIFEQSISDIEEIRTQIENQGKVEEEKETEKKISKRKKDGIFYTPAYIVDYIVTNSLGKYLGEHEENLKEKYKLKEDILEKNYRKREIEAYTEYQKILHNVKVLDPACGSGAFLVRVFDFLLAENKRVANILYIEGDQIKLGDDEDVYRDILKNNIYGVDLNEESVEITKLSLWLKSAVRGRKLVTLDNNIKCGNSLIDDPAVAGDKAFNWNTEFADIMASGGFDVIVGNPPYGAKFTTCEIDYLRIQYPNQTYQLDSYLIFIELVAKLIKLNSFVAFIMPNTWLSTLFSTKIRRFVFNTFSVLEINHYSYPVFVDATVETDIYVFKYPFIKDNNRICVNVIDKDLFSKESLIDQNLIIQKEGGPVNIYEKPEFTHIKNKIHDNSSILGSLTQIVQGTKPFQVGKGVPKQTEEIVKIQPYVSEIKETDKFQPLLRGSLMGRYKILWSNDYWIKYGDWLAEPRYSAKFDSDEKILIRQTGDSIIAAYDNLKFIARDNLYVVRDDTKKLNLKYLLTILNSELITWYFQKIVNPEEGKTMAQVKRGHLEVLPIQNISLPEQQPFIDRADMMLALNRELHEKSDAFLKNISTKYKIEKITRKLEKWWELDFAEFVRELKAKISLEEQEELMSYFSKRKTEVIEIVNRINAIDKEIDGMVFELYGLNEEEKRVVLCYN